MSQARLPMGSGILGCAGRGASVAAVAGRARLEHSDRQGSVCAASAGASRGHDGKPGVASCARRGAVRRPAGDLQPVEPYFLFFKINFLRAGDSLTYPYKFISRDG